MIDAPQFLLFVAAAAVLTITPGLDTAMVLRTAAVEGTRPAASAGIGIALGCLVWGAAVSLGLGTLLQASAFAFAVVKWTGALYLLWLGATLLIRPRQALTTDAGPAAPVDGRTALKRGFLSNVLNPKVGVFYVTFLPQFIPPGANVAATSFLLAAIHAVMGLAWFAVLIAATVPLGRILRRPRVVQTLDRATGAVFILFGLKLATAKAA